MSEFHSFDWARGASVFRETRVPNPPACRPPYSWTDPDGIQRYPVMLDKHTCPECGAVWQFRDDFMWHLAALPTARPTEPRAESAETEGAGRG